MLSRPPPAAPTIQPMSLDSAVMGTVGRVAAAVSQPDQPTTRAEAVLDELRAIIPFEAAEISAWDPLREVMVPLANDGYDERVLEAAHSRQNLDDIRRLGMPATGAPMRMRDLPGDRRDVWLIEEVLLPAGFKEGLTMCLRTSDGRFTGMINLSTTDAAHPSDTARDALASLGPALANLADHTQYASWVSCFLGTGSVAIGLDAEGHPIPLPGARWHRLLNGSGPLLTIAQASAVEGRWRTFLWPDGSDYLRVKVVPLSGSDRLNAVVTLDEVSIDPLTPRELEVLTLAAEGLSNAEIGDALIVSGRTVSTHVEHILSKLGAPTRAAAAAQAIYEGMVLGSIDRHDGR